MAVLGRVLISSAERLDLPDFLSIDSYTQGDFKYLMRSFVGGDKPYVLTGFDVINPNSAIGTQNITIKVADSVVYYPGSLAGPFFHGLEEGNEQSTPLIPELRKNATNYVYLTLTTFEAAKDTRAFWDPDKEAGLGGEFTQDINTQTVLSVDVNVSVSTFPENTIPICIVKVGPNFIQEIEDARDMMFRLGSGGLNPNPLNTYMFREDPTEDYTRTEPNTTISNALDPNPFQGGDKNIRTLKEWMDVVMTKLLELGGTTYWYENASTFSTVNSFKDSLTTSIKSKGTWISSDITEGLLTWTEDIIVQSASDNKDIIIRDGSKTLNDNQVMYITQERGGTINSGSADVQWLNGIDHVNGALGAFENLSKGDWVKKSDDEDYRYARVEEFYAGQNKTGGVTVAGNALSIKLSELYSGTSELKQGVYVKGSYINGDIKVADRNDPDLTQSGGDLYWLAMRSDTVMSVSDITTTNLTIDIENHDGSTAKCTSVAHGLQDKQRITINGSTNFNGTYQVEVETDDIFYINLSGGPHGDELAQTAYYAVVTTQARSTNDGFELESANHNFQIDDLVIVEGTANYNGSFRVFPLSDTTFSLPVPGAIANETLGTAKTVNIYVRTDIGPTKLSQGENKSVGQTENESIMNFIGMDNDAQVSPVYNVPSNYNTIHGYVNFNSDLTDDLTKRVSKLTSMMADKAQDKTIKLLTKDVDLISSTANVGARDISFQSLNGGVPVLNILMTGSDNNGSLDLTSTISLNTNQVAYIELDRNESFSLASATISNISDMVIGENTLIIAARLSDTDVHLWDGSVLKSDTVTDYKLHRNKVVRQNPNIKLIAGGKWSWALSSNTLSWDSDAYIQVPGAIKERNTIQSGSIMLLSDGQVAYVEVNRINDVATNLTVNTADISTLDLSNPDILIIANRVGDEVVVRDALLDLSDIAEETFENNNSKLIEGGTWSLVGTDLTLSDTAYVQIPGSLNTYNEISAQTISLPNSSSVAYVNINRGTSPSVLTVNVADINSVSEDKDTLIIARRVSDGVVVGSSSFLLKDGEFLELDGALAEINRYNGQLAVTPYSPINTRVKISGSEILKLSGSTISLEQRSLLLDFPGAEIDFSTGEVFESNGTTPLNDEANDFTPATIGANEYFFYSVTLLPNIVNENNTITGQILVLPANASNAVLADTPRAPFPSSGIKLANIYVQESGGSIANIDYANITTLGVGGSGSGGTGDANELLERLKNRLANYGAYEYMTPVIFSSVDETLTDKVNTTAQYSVVDSNYQFSTTTVPPTGLAFFKQLNSPDEDASDQFGYSVAISGDYMVVGAPFDYGEMDVNNAAGEVYVFKKDQGGPNNWGPIATLNSTSETASDQFGYSVAISGDYIVVGAPFDGGSNDMIAQAGEAYVFKKDEGGPDNWGPIATLNSPMTDEDSSDQFGVSVAISGDYIVVGAFGDEGSDNLKNFAGEAYVFKKDEGGPDNWGQVTSINPISQDEDSFSGFGWSVAIDGDYIVVGALNNDGSNDMITQAGEAYVFKKDEGGVDNWGQVARLNSTSETLADKFGSSVAISGDYIVVAAINDDGVIDANGNAGEVYVFKKDEGGPDNWGPIATLNSDNEDQNDEFGTSVAISGDYIVVGARADDGVMDTNDNAGEVYVFRKDEGGPDNWGQVATLNSNNEDQNDQFGWSVAISGNYIVVGANGDNGVIDANGNAGEAYIYTLPQPAQQTNSIFTSVQLLDDEFLQEEIELNEIELIHYWDLDKLDTNATYEVSRDNGNQWQTVSMSRIGNSETYRGLHQFTEEPTNSFSQTEGILNGTYTDLTDLNELSRQFTLASTTTIKKVTANINKTGAATGYVFAVAVRDNGSGLPSTDPLDEIAKSKFVSIDGLVAGAQSVDFEIRFTVPAEDYHIIIKTDILYKTEYSNTVGANKISVEDDSTDIVYTLEGLELNLRVRITNGTDAVASEGFGVLYKDDNKITYVDGNIFRNVTTFVGDVDNLDTFTLTFLPDPHLLHVYELGTGQVYRYGAFIIQGHQVIFEPNTFNKPDTVSLEFLQIQGGSFDNSDRNGSILVSNHLGSTDTSIDFSVPGRGIFLRRPDGTLREITIDNNDNIVIYSV